MAELNYHWEDYNEQKAISGSLVGVWYESDQSNYSYSGKLRSTSVSNIYTLSVPGCEIKVTRDGYIYDAPNLPEGYKERLKMLVAEMGTTGAVGTSFTRKSTSGEPEDEVEVDLSEMQPRDYFAVHALSVMMAQTKHPETFDDEDCIYYAKAAYRWAQAMVIAAIGTKAEKVGNAYVNVTLVNNSENVTINVDEFCFILGKDDAYNRTEHASFGDTVTLAPGNRITITNIEIPGDSLQYVGQKFATPAQLAVGGRRHNVMLYDPQGVSETYDPDDISPSTVFNDGGSYTITYSQNQEEEEEQEEET